MPHFLTLMVLSRFVKQLRGPGVPVVRKLARPFLGTPSDEDLVVLKGLLESGRVRPVIDRTYPLSETWPSADGPGALAQRLATA